MNKEIAMVENFPTQEAVSVPNKLSVCNTIKYEKKRAILTSK
jgi:hypothetical protein